MGMKATGIVRRVDGLNRIVIPRELCRNFGLAEGTPVEILTEDGRKIILRRYDAGVNITEDLQHIREKAREMLNPEAALKMETLIKQLAEVLKE